VRPSFPIIVPAPASVSDEDEVGIDDPGSEDLDDDTGIIEEDEVEAIGGAGTSHFKE
jgi:hypothetical protein